MTDDGSFRVITAETTETVRGAVRAQRASGETARHFGDLLTAAVLFRHTMAPDLRVQSILRGAGGAWSLIADSHPSGATRGLVQLARGTEVARPGPGTLLRLMRTLQSGDVNQGVIELSEGDGVTQGLMSYMHVSEQVDTMLAVGTLTDGEEVVAAGGYLVQLLPGVGRGPLMVMTERLDALRDLTGPLCRGLTPAALLDELLFGMAFTRLGETHVGFECWCSELRLVSALATLPRQDLEHLLEGGEPLEITCDYCAREYRIAPAALRGLLSSS